jgi:thiamine-phosphate pyrophosphorylase
LSRRPDFRLIVITDRDLAAPRRIIDVAAAALRGGAPALQLRDKSATARELAETARALLPLVRAHSALLFINDRLDVAMATGADGVHLGPHDLPVEAARRIAPPDFLIGASTDDPARAIELQHAGASYIGCGAVFGTRTKDVGSERIGLQRLDDVARSVNIPVVGIGGINAENIADVAATKAAGAAVVSAVMSAEDPEETTRILFSRVRTDVF